jgi:hypothetical protein
MVISPELLSLLRHTRHDPSAHRGYDHFAGGFRWSDEFPEGFWEVVIRLQDWSHRKLIAHRAAVILGGDIGRFVSTWQEVERDAPNWPGLRPERRDTCLSAQLIAKREEVEAGLEALDQRIRQTQRTRSAAKDGSGEL